MQDVAVRAVKTFVQTFLSTFALGVTGVVDAGTLKALAVASLAAAISAAWNGVVKTA